MQTSSRWRLGGGGHGKIQRTVDKKHRALGDFTRINNVARRTEAKLLARQFNGYDRLDRTSGFDQGVNGPTSALRMSNSPDLVDFEFVEENALGICVGLDKKVRGIQDCLASVRVSVPRCNNHKSPRR